MLSEPLQGNLAALDLGSNSFHMVIARVIDGTVHVVDRVREPVRLAMGLDDENRIDEDTQSRALDSLARFGERIRGLPREQIRAVGTNTLRKAKNAKAFLKEARKMLGVPVEILSGREEARLIYQGVAHTLDDHGERRLVFDIGGGSTECIIGERFHAQQADSLFMGCVSYSQEFFHDGKINQKRMRAARTAAELEIEPIEARYVESGWERCVGASGTFRAVAQILEHNGWSAGKITRSGLRSLWDALVGAGAIEDIKVGGLTDDRKPVIVGGVAIVAALMRRFDVDEITVAKGALREGLLYDLLGRIRHDDHRDQTIQHFCERYSVDLRQAARVERTAIQLLEQTAAAWKLEPQRSRQILGWASRLHEIGLAISYNSYHKHGAYLIQHSEMPGFSKDDKGLVAAIVRGHRRRLRVGGFQELRADLEQDAIRLCILLRLAVLLSRGRRPAEMPKPSITVKDGSLHLGLDADWLSAHPLTQADLEREAKWLATLDITLATG